MTVVPHTTSLQGTRFEVHISARFLKSGVFDAQQIGSVAQARLIRRIGDLTPSQLTQVEVAVKEWLGL